MLVSLITVYVQLCVEKGMNQIYTLQIFIRLFNSMFITLQIKLFNYWLF